MLLKIKMSTKEMEFQSNLIDSLKRQVNLIQIAEIQQLILEEKNQVKSKELELRRKLDHNKARQVLKSLKLKKQHQDMRLFLLESRKQ